MKCNEGILRSTRKIWIKNAASCLMNHASIIKRMLSPYLLHTPIPIHLLGSEFLHHVLPDGPHASSLPVNIHGNGEEKTGQLNTSDGKKNVFSSVLFEPMSEE